MGGVIDFLKQIVEFIGMLIDFAVQLVTGLFDLLKLIPHAVSLLTESLGILPAFLVAFAGVTITVSVIFIIVGRESGGSQK